MHSNAFQCISVHSMHYDIFTFMTDDKDNDNRRHKMLHKLKTVITVALETPGDDDDDDYQITVGFESQQSRMDGWMNE